MTAITKTQPQPITPAKPRALEVMASRLNVEPAKLLETLKQTVFQKATNEELLALVAVANEYGLNPFLKELYAFPAKGGGIVPIVSVDGWNKMLIRQPEFDGIEFDFTDDEAGHPVACTATIYVKGRSRPVKITEYFAECKRNTEPWNTMPRRMLRNRTLCQAARVAFGFSGVSHEDEAATIIDVSAPMPAEPLPKMIVNNTTPTTPQQELEAMVLAAGYTFTDLQQFGARENLIANADSLSGFNEVSTDDAKRLLRVKGKVLECLKIQKEGVQS